MSPQQANIIQKVRQAGCLSPAELQALQTLSDNWETRLRIDQLDYQWSDELPRYLVCVSTKGVRTYHLPAASGSRFTLGIGVFCIFYGLSGAIPVMPLGLFMGVIGLIAIYRSRGQKQGWQAYESARSTYHDERRAALERLPPEYHPASRMCLHCVQPIVW